MDDEIRKALRKIENDGRRSGRTFRMLVKVIGCIFDTPHIYVICPSLICARMMCQDFEKMLPPMLLVSFEGSDRIVVKGGAKVWFLAQDSCDLGRFYGVRGLVAIDHAAYPSPRVMHEIYGNHNITPIE